MLIGPKSGGHIISLEYLLDLHRARHRIDDGRLNDRSGSVRQAHGERQAIAQRQVPGRCRAGEGLVWREAPHRPLLCSSRSGDKPLDSSSDCFNTPHTSTSSSVNGSLSNVSSAKLAKKKSRPARPLSVLPPPLEWTVLAFRLGRPFAPLLRLATRVA